MKQELLPVAEHLTTQLLLMPNALESSHPPLTHVQPSQLVKTVVHVQVLGHLKAVHV
jgi:hypothetical protein